MSVNPIVGITMRLIRSSRKTFKFPDTIESELRELFWTKNIRGVFRVRSLRATKGRAHRKGFVWTALDEKESIIRFTYQPGDNNTCVKYSLEIEDCRLSLTDVFARLLEREKRPVVRQVKRPTVSSVIASPAAKEETPVELDSAAVTAPRSPVDLFEVLQAEGYTLAEAKRVLDEVSGLLDKALSVKTEMLRLRSLYLAEKSKLECLNRTLQDNRYQSLLSAMQTG